MVAGAGISAGKAEQLLHVVDVEIADAEIADRALGEQGLEAGKHLLEPGAPAPMQKIEIDAVGLEPLQASLAGGDGAGPRRVLRLDLAHDEAVVAASFDRRGNDLLGTALRVKLGRVDQRHAEIETQSESRDLLVERAPALTHPPGALAELRHFIARVERDRGKTGVSHWGATKMREARASE